MCPTYTYVCVYHIPLSPVRVFLDLIKVTNQKRVHIDLDKHVYYNDSVADRKRFKRYAYHEYER